MNTRLCIRMLAGTALLTIAALPSTSLAATQNGTIVVAQAQSDADKKTEADKKKAQQQQQQKQQQQPRAVQQPKPPVQPTAQQPKPPTPPATQLKQQGTPPAGQQGKSQGGGPAAQQQQQQQQQQQRQQGGAPAAQQQQQQKQQQRNAPTVVERPKPDPNPALQQGTSPGGAGQQQGGRTGQQQNQQQGGRPGQQQQQNIQQGTRQGQPPQGAPAAIQQQQQQQQGAPAAIQQQQGVRGPAATVNPVIVAPVLQPRDKSEFIARSGGQPSPRMDQIKQERQESRDGNRIIIRERDRTIIRDGDRTIIRHNESGRFAIDARDVRTERRGGLTETIVVRPNGVRIITVTDADGRVIRRMRRYPDDREVVIIDNSFAASRPEMLFVQLAAPVIRIPRERYIVEAGRARPDDIYGVFIAPPVERIAERYTLDQVRFSAPLRDRMPRIDLDVTFETGSWQLTPDQIDRLAAVAQGLNKALERNPREVFMVEGYTDAVGDSNDNLSLSDRRAESVAVALAEQFQVPAENLVTQGYGEQNLKVPTQGPERANRRVAVRRITPLLDQQAGGP